MFRWLKKLFRLGLWRVRYKDGQESRLMFYVEARDLAAMFDGEFEFVE